ncbi:MAG: hypothetical protein ISR65_07640 [Bacteriovoracaceae bacterium]|nr:hypothetical protein [Bacteriovoracaceae bacterium]
MSSIVNWVTVTFLRNSVSQKSDGYPSSCYPNSYLIAFMLIGILFFITSVSADNDPFAVEMFNDHKVESFGIDAPKRGTIKGEFASLGKNALNHKTGSFSFKLPLEFPSLRGEMIYPFEVVYSPSFGISEFGIGWSSQLKFSRFVETGKINYLNDQLIGKFGKMQKGNDDFWYPQNLEGNVRAKVSSREIIVYLSDGKTLYYGDQEDDLYVDQTKDKKVHSWYLRLAVDKVGKRTQFFYTRSTKGGRSYLQSIKYGGLNQDFQYKIDLEYESTQGVLYDYTLGYKRVLDQRVKLISVRSQAMAFNQFVTRYSYHFKYIDRALSPGHNLSSVQKIFTSTGNSSSTAAEPAMSFQYDQAYNYFEKLSWTHDKKLDYLANRYKYMLTSYNHTSFVDFNNDGRVDFEIGKMYDVYLNQDSLIDTLEGKGEGAEQVSTWCLFPVPYSRRPRTFQKFWGPNKPQFVYDLFDYQGHTILDVCLPNGKSVDYVVFPKFWGNKNKTKIADLNNDNLPDLLHLRGNAYEVIYNKSTSAGKLSFSAPTKPKYINLPSNFSSFWVTDINGDGHSDLVLKGKSAIFVHHGDSEGKFATQFKAYNFYFPGGMKVSKDLKNGQILFIDLNKDSLLDIILQGNDFITMYINNGDSFIYKRIPGLFINPGLYNNMVVADLGGSGNTRLYSNIMTARSKYKMLYLDLDRPGLGLMSSASDGKGNTLRFDYGKSVPEIGMSSRKTIITDISTTSAAKGKTTSTMDYAGVNLHTVSNTFLGFSEISSTIDKYGKTIHRYKFTEDNIAYLHHHRSFDKQQRENLIKYKTNTYEQNYFAGIPFWKKTESSEGFHNFAATDYITLKTSYFYDKEGICKTSEVKSDELNTSTTIFYYTGLALFENHLSCLPSEIIKAGTSKRNEASYRLSIERDDFGRPHELLVGYDAPTSIQVIQYGKNQRIKNIFETTKGITSYNYDNHYRLTAVINPDNTRELVNAFFDNNDKPATITQKRGSQSMQKQFRFDSLGRLSKTWDNLGAYSEHKPQFQYSYHFADQNTPGKIFQRSFFETAKNKLESSLSVTLLTGDGDDVATIEETNSNFVVKGLTKRLPGLGIIKTFQNYLAPKSKGISSIKLSDLSSTNTKLISSTTQNFLGQATSAKKASQNNVYQNIKSSFEIDGGLLIEKIVENDNPSWTEIKKSDAFGRLVKYIDQDDNPYLYSYDGLGRIADINLPDGSTQSIDYDDRFGKISKVTRSGIGSLEYKYDPTSSMLVQKRRMDLKNNLINQESIVYDNIFRIKSKTLTSFVTVTGDVEDHITYNYFYDGENLAQSKQAGQLGLLTGITSQVFAKNWVYRIDGKLQERSIILANKLKFKTLFDYFSGGIIKSKSHNLVDLKTDNIIASNSLNYKYNRFGNIVSIGHNSKEFLHAQYNSFGEIDHIDVKGHKSIDLSYDPLTRKNNGHLESINSKIIFKHNWELDNRMNVKRADYTFEQGEVANLYTYNNRKYLEEVESSSLYNGSDNNTEESAKLLRYTYNSTGLLTKFERDQQNRKLSKDISSWSIGDDTYELDTIGRVTSKGSKQFEYGANSRIKHVTNNDTNEENQVTYIYDEAKNPILKFSSAGVEAYIENTVISNNHIYEPIKLGPRIFGHFQDDEFIPVSADHLSSYVLDESKDNEDKNVNLATPFGERENHTRTEASKVADFTLKGYDPDIEAVRMGRRYYDPVAKRFLTPDPLFLEQPNQCIKSPVECNLYSYAGNDPVNFIDPSGLGRTSYDDLDLRINSVNGKSLITSGGSTYPNDASIAVGNSLLNNDFNYVRNWAQANDFKLNQNGRLIVTEFSRQTSKDPQLFKAAIAGITFIGVGLATKEGLSFAIQGRELKFRKNFRLAPFGNRTRSATGRFPHYHRRVLKENGKATVNGQGIGRHRPWDTKSTDTSFFDRF